MTWIPSDLYQKIKEMIPIAAVDLVITHKGRLLIVLRNNEPDKGKWWVPGGRIFHNETLLTAVRRVLWEETGLRGTVLSTRPRIIDLFRPPNLHFVDVVFHVEAENTDIKLDQQHSSHDWVDLEKLPNHVDYFHDPTVMEIIRAGLAP